MKKIKVILFKETGKYYTEDEITLPDPNMAVYEIMDWLYENYKSFSGMCLVAMLSELKHGYPIMIPAADR